ncbi:DNA glycosylase [Tirmania nivea]|nr:DNA glycosylase [Tirmania nivea]
MTEPQVETFREEVEDLSIDTEDSGEIVEGKGKKPARGGGNKKRPKLSPPSPLPPPPHWEEMYSLVRSMRSRIPAPVDTMGCERLAQPIGGPVTPAVSRFQTLVSLLLSSQTKDTVTAVAVRKMQTLLPGGLTIPSILATDPQTLDGLITPVGFHNKKTQYLLQAAQICREKYNSDIPRSIEELCSLPGVGPKMAHLCMSAAWNETQGIGVDVHVHRITNMWKWTGKKGTETPEQTRLALESWLPKDKWREINHLLVGFGQTVCLSRAPRCGECSLADRGLCRAARREFKQEEVEEEVAVVKLEVKSEAIDDERVKREWKMEPEYAKEDIPDMEDILGGELQQLRSRRRRARA